MPARICLCLALLVVAGPAAAAPRFKVSLLTMSPGPHPFERFGHTALAVEDAKSGTELAYNFGAFDGEDPALWQKAVRKELRYWVLAMNPGETAFRYAQRDIQVQELALDDVQAEALSAELAELAQLDRRVFAYELFTNNCVTRVRDVLDQALGGALRRHTATPSPTTFREEVLRTLAPLPLLAVAADLVYGPYTDLPRSRWELLFLPGPLHDALLEMRAGPGPLVKGEKSWRGPEFAPLPRWPSPLVLAGAVLLALLYGLLRLHRPRDPAAGRALVGWTGAGLALLSGGLGVFLLYGAATPHAWFQGNANRLLFTPIDLLLVPLLALLAVGRLGGRGARVLGVVLALAAAPALWHVLGAHVLAGCPQRHGHVIAWALGGRLVVGAVIGLTLRRAV